MSVPLEVIFDQFKTTKICQGQKSTDSFKEIERFLKFLKLSDFTSLTNRSCWAYLDIRSETLGDYARQQCYQTLRHFSGYACFVNDDNEFLRKRKRRLNGRRTPIILNNANVGQIIEGLDQTCASRPLSAKTYSTLVGVLYITGMRVSEALIELSDKDVNVEENYIYVKPGKSPRDRYIPIAPSASRRLAAYRSVREQYYPGQTERFFLLHTGAPKSAASFRTIFNKVTAELGYRSRHQVGYDSRSLMPHDLRHSYATNKVLELHRRGLNVNAELPQISTLLGHESPKETYWYYQSVPEILAEILQKGAGE